MRNIQNTENITRAKLHCGTRYLVTISTGKHSKKVLGTGKTLIEALMMRDWCEANGWVSFVGKWKYIQQKTPNSFQVYKDFPDGRKCFGHFRSLESAQKERDLLIKYNWDWDLMVELE